MIKYKIIDLVIDGKDYDRAKSQFEEKVNTEIQKGWITSGGVSITLHGSPYHGFVIFAQALTKEEL